MKASHPSRARVALLRLVNAHNVLQIQADLGEGHVNVVQAKEALLTDNHLALVMEYAACGSLTSYVTDRWQNAQSSGFFLQEDEARYFFRVGHTPLILISILPLSAKPSRIVSERFLSAQLLGPLLGDSMQSYFHAWTDQIFTDAAIHKCCGVLS